MYKLKVRPFRKLFYNNKDNYGAFGCNLVENLTTDKIIELSKYNSLTIKGNIPDLSCDQDYIVSCKKVIDQKYGIQYEAIITSTSNRDYTDNIDYTKNNIESISTDIQKSFLKEIVTELQLQSIFDVYEKPIDEIINGTFDYKKVYNIGKFRYNILKDKVIENFCIYKIIVEFSKHGLNFRQASCLIELYSDPDLVIRKIYENPYDMLMQVPHMNFKKIDKFALDIGVEHNDKRRICACFEYFLEKESYLGHVWIDVNIIYENVFNYIGDNTIDKNEIIEYINNSSRLILIDGYKLAKIRDYEDEIEIKDELFRIRDAENRAESNFNIDIDDFILKQEQKQKFKYDEVQKEAFSNVIENNVFILTGFGGTGKCVTGDTYIYTDKGMLKIEDIPEHYSVINNECNAKINSYDLNGNAKHLNTSHWFNMGKSETIKITTTQGYEIEGTPVHPVIIINKYGKMEFKQLQYINKDDIIAISTNNNIFGKKYLDLDICYLLGFLTGDGNLNGENRKIKSYELSYSKSDKFMTEKVNNILYDKIGVKYIKDYYKFNSNAVDHKFYGKENHIQLKQYGLSMKLSKDKEVPFTILSAKKECIVAYLQGLFDTDATINVKYRSFEWCTASKELAKQVHLLLLNIGIRGTLTTRKVKGYDNNIYYRVFISGYNLIKYHNEIGFKYCMHKKEKLEEFFNSGKKINPNVDTLINQKDNIIKLHRQLIGKPYYKKYNHYKVMCKDGIERGMMHVFDNRRHNVSNYLLSNILESIDIKNELTEYLSNVSNNIFSDTIDSINKSENIVYDFTVPETHSFVANGFINHNTFTTNGILNMFDSFNMSYILMSPSAKAAKVLKLSVNKEENSNRETSTIHRGLGWTPEGFAFNKENKLPYDVVLIDEISMVGLDLFKDLVNAIEDGTKLIIVGDVAQLASLSKGSILDDMLQSEKFSNTRLTKIFRQEEDSGIINVATKTRNGEYFINNGDTKIKKFGKNNDTLFIPTNKNTTLDCISKVYKQLLNKGYNDEDITVIMPANVGECGTKVINRVLQELNNPKVGFANGIKHTIDDYSRHFRENDKVIHIKNDYNKQWYDENYEIIADKKAKAIFNGDIGRVIKVEYDSRVVWVKYEDDNKIIRYENKDLYNLLHAWSLSVHKFQGSQSKVIIFGMDSRNAFQAKRNLIYTAETRASELLIIVGEGWVINKGIDCDEVLSKRTFLKDLLINDKLDDKIISNIEGCEY